LESLICTRTITPSSAEPDNARMMFSVRLSAHGLVSRDTVKVTVRLGFVPWTVFLVCAAANRFGFFGCLAVMPFMSNMVVGDVLRDKLIIIEDYQYVRG